MREDERLPEINVAPMRNYIIHNLRGTLLYFLAGDKFFLVTSHGMISLAFKRESIKVKARLLEKTSNLVQVKGWAIGDDDLFYFVCVESLVAVQSIPKDTILFINEVKSQN